MGSMGQGHGTKQAGQGHCQTHITKERSKASGDSGQPEQGKEQAALEEKGEEKKRHMGTRLKNNTYLCLNALMKPSAMIMNIYQ